MDQNLSQEQVKFYSKLFMKCHEENNVPCPHVNCSAEWSKVYNAAFGLAVHYKATHPKEFTGLSLLDDAKSLLGRRQFHITKLFFQHHKALVQEQVNNLIIISIGISLLYIMLTH